MEKQTELECLLTSLCDQPAHPVVKPLVDPYLVMQFWALQVGVLKRLRIWQRRRYIAPNRRSGRKGEG